MSENTPHKISQKQLLRIFTDLKTHSDDGMCFLLGAGASFNSGIPTGGELAKRWYEKIKEDLTVAELEKWQKGIVGFDEKQLAKCYPQIFEQRFDNPSTGFYELQDVMKDAEPSIGYSFLAQILADETLSHKFVITTNFDHMVEDAIRSYTNARPLVCGHESLAEYINTRSSRPTVIKVHRDLLLHPFNGSDNTNKLKEAWKKTLQQILKNHHLVVIGYGGNDGSLMDYLSDIKDIRQNIYWCYRSESELDERILKLLDKDYDRLVKITGFDEFMLALGEAHDCPSLTNQADLSKSWIVTSALEKAQRYQQQLEKFAEKTVKDDNKDTDTTEALTKLLESDGKPATHWWAIQLEINQETDNDRKQLLYEQGLAQLPDSAELMGNYATFLHTIGKDDEQAENYYRKALQLDPNHADFNGNYALFLHNVGKDDEQVERYYRKALELDPDDANINCNYANFLHNVGKDYEQAERYYRKALELDSDNANNNGNYAAFLHTIRKDYEQAKRYYRKALELDPDDAINNGNYANLLHTIHEDDDQAERYYRKALELNPDAAINNGNYANFLSDIRKDYKQAESYYSKALKLDPDDANINGNYAGLLLALGRKAEVMPHLDIAMQADDHEDLLLECWFYCLAHFPEQHEQAKQAIEALLKQGVRSVSWDFSANIHRAEQDGYENMDELRRIANEISAVE